MLVTLLKVSSVFGLRESLMSSTRTVSVGWLLLVKVAGVFSGASAMATSGLTICRFPAVAWFDSAVRFKSTGSSGLLTSTIMKPCFADCCTYKYRFEFSVCNSIWLPVACGKGKWAITVAGTSVGFGVGCSLALASAAIAPTNDNTSVFRRATDFPDVDEKDINNSPIRRTKLAPIPGE